ncbi:MAG: polysaccharide deacetylase family protein [Thermomicrobiales bacterium]
MASDPTARPRAIGAAQQTVIGSPPDPPTATVPATATMLGSPAVVESPAAPATPPDDPDTAGGDEPADQADEPTSTPRPDPPPDPGAGASLVIQQGDSGRGEIALTFDAGDDRGKAELILDTLAEYGIKASFGITGHWTEANPDLVARMADEGHMIFNHTWSHRSWTGFSTSAWDPGVLTTEERLQELEETEAVIREATGGYETAPYFRPPFGDYDEGTLADLAGAGYYLTIMWSCDSLGWNGASVEEIVQVCGVELAAPGAIILMHVGEATLDAEALPPLIDTLEEQGYDFVTIEELLQG